METAWKTGGQDAAAAATRRHNNTYVTWDACGIISTPAGTPYDWSTPVSARLSSEARVVHALLSSVTGNTKLHDAGVESNSIHHRVPPDPHMMCLKLGKRHYYEDLAESSTTTKRGKPPSSPAAAAAVVARCQVEGCHVALGEAKEYYRKHKVCELHSKAPKVVVAGVVQRFCQQCSRFHGVTEFDEAKRSCRRRLKGHNQRRRKVTHSIKLGPSSKPGCAFSLLSSPDTKPAGDLPSRCSAALYELIAANRATSVISNPNFYHQSLRDNITHTFPDTQTWDRFGYTTTTTTAVDLKQSPALEFGLLSVKEPEEWTDYCWSSFGGGNVV